MVTGVIAGSVTITYSIGSCTTTSTVTVAPAASAGTISGPASVCVGNTITLIDGAGSGSWSSSNTGIATVGVGTGIVTGMGAGVVTISYSVTNTCGTVSATYTVNVLAPGVLPISGLSTICAGTFTNYSDGTTGGVWSASNSHGTISSTGLFTGISAGIDTIKYQVTNACGTFSTTKIITIGAYLTAGTITGPGVLCAGTTMTDADLAPGGTWSSSNTSIATVSGLGVVTGVAGGLDTIMYTVTSSCGSAVATHPITVNPVPNAGAIVGSAILCAGMTSPYSDVAPGGTWTMTNGLATVGSSTGLVTAIAPGIDTVVYTVTNSCGTARAIKPVTIGAFLTAGTISGASSLCAGTNITLTDPAAGGVWSASNGNASVSGGTVTGITGGVDTILYTVTSACGSVSASHPVTVNPLPYAGSITGPSGICTGVATLYTDASAGGVWSISNAHATITGGGSVTGVTPGTDTISYTVTNGCGTATTTLAITIGTISSAGTITGPGNVCIGSGLILIDVAPGGTWSSSNTAVATVGSTTGVVTGVTSGTAAISYTISGSCGSATATKVVTVSPVAVVSAISGPSSMCAGTVTLFTDASPGGVWSASNSSATVTSGGIVNAITAGTDTISYTTSTGCGAATATKVVTILPGSGAGVITGAGSVCIGSSIPLTDGVSCGVWSSSNSHALVGTSGDVTGVTAGADTIMYTVSTSCGVAIATHPITVVTPGDAGIISGPSTVCVGSLVTMTETIPGGAWSSSNPHATITTGGVVTGITPGVDTISYTLVGACGLASTTKIITVNLLPSISPISAPASVCVGAAALFTDASLGGVWTSTNAHATIGSSSGIATGVSAGADTIVYSVASGCGTVSTTAAIVVNALPDAGTISGPDSVCIGTSISLSDPAAGGTWSAGNGNATVGGGGVVTGISGGTDPISYTVTNSCGSASAIKIVSVVSFPTSGFIIGSPSVCVGSGITLTDAIPGGSWAASNGNAIVAGPGIIDGVTVGVDTVFYIVTNSCGTSTTSKILNVYPVPVVTPITGTASECVGTTSTLGDAVSGGVWTSSVPAVATVGVSSGVVTGVSTGTSTITYTVTNTFGCPTSVTVTNTVNAMPVLPAITGSSNACIGATTPLSDAVAGGTWTSSNTTIAGVDPSTGIVTGVATGSVIITYTVVNPCGTSFVVQPMAVNPMPVVPAITGVTHQCEFASSTLSDATTGGTWSSSNTAVATVGSSSGVVTGVAAGTTTINYLFTSSAGCSVLVTAADTVVAAPIVSAITGVMHECAGATTTLSEATVGGSWTSANPSIATVSGGVVTGVAAGTVFISNIRCNQCVCWRHNYFDRFNQWWCLDCC
jgi:trimeric autotransporter adhesin